MKTNSNDHSACFELYRTCHTVPSIYQCHLQRKLNTALSRIYCNISNNSRQRVGKFHSVDKAQAKGITTVKKTMGLVTGMN